MCCKWRMIRQHCHGEWANRHTYRDQATIINTIICNKGNQAEMYAHTTMRLPKNLLQIQMIMKKSIGLSHPVIKITATIKRIIGTWLSIRSHNFLFGSDLLPINQMNTNNMHLLVGFRHTDNTMQQTATGPGNGIRWYFPNFQKVLLKIALPWCRHYNRIFSYAKNGQTPSAINSNCEHRANPPLFFHGLMLPAFCKKAIASAV